MANLKIESMIFTRGEDGNLIPDEIELETLPDKPTVKIVPLTRGKLQEIYTKAKSSDLATQISSDSDIIKFGLIEPKLTEQQIIDIKSDYATAITTAILAVSLGKSQKDISEVIDKSGLLEEDIKKKNLI